MTTAPATLAELRAALPERDTPLRITLPDGDLGAAFHVTEVQHHQITSLDCGQGAHDWTEVVIQLLDGQMGTPLSPRKLRGILMAASAQQCGLGGAAVYFEGALGNRGLEKLKITGLSEDGSHLTLGPVTPVCKPGLAFEARTGTACC